MLIRNPLQPYHPAVLALFFAGCLFVCYCFARSMDVRTWEGDDEAE